jgi:hypothetical protein
VQRVASCRDHHPAPITRVRIEVDRGEFTQVIELHGTATAPVDGAFAAVEDGDYGMVELRLRGRLNQPVDEAQ